MPYIGRHRAARPLYLRRPVIGGALLALVVGGPALAATNGLMPSTELGTPSAGRVAALSTPTEDAQSGVAAISGQVRPSTSSATGRSAGPSRPPATTSRGSRNSGSTGRTGTGSTTTSPGTSSATATSAPVTSAPAASKTTSTAPTTAPTAPTVTPTTPTTTTTTTTTPPAAPPSAAPVTTTTTAAAAAPVAAPTPAP